MKIQLSDHFNYSKLLRFTFPSIIMMVFTSIYGVVDGFFVSNFAGQTEFAAVNFIFPYLMILGTPGFLFGTGGSALVAKIMGEGDHVRSNRIFSLLVAVSAGCGVVLSIVGLLTLRAVGAAMGAEGEMLDMCVRYGRIVLLAGPCYVVQMEFQSFFITAEKPKLGLAATVAAGVTNMVLDALFVGVFRWGLEGAAAATALSQVVGGLLPILYFLSPNTSLLRLVRPVFDGRALLNTFTNGSSELMSNISMSLVSMLYNVQLMAYADEAGVSAYGVMMYVNMIFLAIFIGYSIGTAPVISFHYGAGHSDELGGLLRKSLVIIGISSVAMLALAEVLAAPLAQLFVGYDEALMGLTLRGFRIFSFSFLFAGLAIFGSSFFTALNNGLVSAAISFLRTLVFQVAAVLILPLIWDIDGIWISIVAAEAMAALVTVLFLVFKRKKYRY